jgi:hypothetical protein
VQEIAEIHSHETQGSGGNVVLSLFPAQIRQSYSPLGLKQTFSFSYCREFFSAFREKSLRKATEIAKVFANIFKNIFAKAKIFAKTTIFANETLRNFAKMYTF